MVADTRIIQNYALVYVDCFISNSALGNNFAFAIDVSESSVAGRSIIICQCTGINAGIGGTFVLFIE
jgi:hypothetical protein